MHIIFAMARFYPYWGLPLVLIFVELGLFMRRKASKSQFYYFGIAGLLLLSIIAWFVFRGDLNSDRWVRSVFGL